MKSTVDSRQSTVAHASCLCAFIIFLALPGVAFGYIERMYSFQEVVDESTNIAVGKIISVDHERQTAVAALERPLKGELEYQKVQMNIGLAAPEQAGYLMALVEVGDPYILFYKRDGDNIASCAHSADTWFQLYATDETERKNVWWRMSHLEIYMGRTFNGPTPDLIRLAESVTEKHATPPAPDPNVPQLDFTRPRPRRQAKSTKVLLARGAEWKYLKGTGEASADRPDHSAWRGPSFDDSGWQAGPAPVGYGDPPFGTVLDDMQRTAGRPGYTSLYLRRRIEAPDPSTIAYVELNVDYDDGFVLWINGREAISAFKPQGTIAFNSLASGNHESGVFQSFFVSEPKGLLERGPNLIAIQVFNATPTSSDLKIDVEIKAGLNPPSADGGGFKLLGEWNCPPGTVRGVSFSDLEGDGWLGILACREGGSLLLKNEKGHLSPAGLELNLGAGPRTAAWADFDLDGSADLLVDGPRLLKRSGASFAEVAGLPSISAAKRTRRAAGWIDANGDGLPDILAGGGGGGLRLLVNSGKGPGWFRDQSDAAGLGEKGIAAGDGPALAFADFDGDGYTDFFDSSGNGVLARNQGDGTFKSETKSGIEIAPEDGSGGAAFGDFDGDGDLDLFLASARKAKLYQNQNNGTFRDVAGESGDLGRDSSPSLSGVFGDVNGDGFLDLFVSHTGAPGRLYLGDGKGKFVDVTERAGLAKLPPASGAALVDIDGDGSLDLALNLEDRVAVYSNTMARAEERGSLQVRILARKGTIGAVIRVLDPAGKTLGMRELNGGEARGGQSPPVAHFGLPVGASKVSAALADGRVAQVDAEVKKEGTALVLKEEDFK